jgi:outer membrane protein OmpA-like peptidoglycan-associated protein
MRQTLLLSFLFSSFLSCFAQDKIEVFFDFNTYGLNPAAITTLNDWILKQPNSKVLKIYGFCDWKGSTEYNDTLSLQRVQVVYEYLTAHKISIDEEYLKKGFGKNFTQDKNQALNRKVEILYNHITPGIVKISKEITLAEKVKTAKKEDLIRLKNINFYNNSARVVPNSKGILYDLLCVMQENPTVKIEIQGHICCQVLNSMDHISTARAKAIYNHLIQNKISRNRLTYKGYGVSNPIYPIPEKSELEENENRRVEIKILEN